ncbi:nicotinamide riboside transporter PnuC [Leyella stercorea]|uniref:Nicotinamide riboside transporter PnuC n=1 Tax=Leyella stercorea CAG:629 TaxID=1263103 RepID=R7H1C5_9BACT|nr:nicotinamide riboside transporter PnuC [Leyella stercorea]CDE33116.1 nicotinamide mononucleotide transporter PnuC [Leyella stercorea CAG:629]
MTDFLSTHWLDIVTTILGLIYLILEYRASIALWVVGIVMPAMDIYLYWSHGLYGDAGMAVYYTLAAIYGYAVWKFGAKWKAMIKRKGSDKKEGASAVSSDKIEAASAVSSSSEDLPITFFPRRLILRTLGFFVLAWAATYYVLVAYTNSTVPLLDAFTNALSFVGLWALARKYVEQWLFWIAVDVVCCYLYVVKGIPFKAGLYGLYVVIAVMGYWKWKGLAKKAQV